MTKEEETKKVVPQRQNVHVVFFSCPNCGEEVEYIQFCPDCGKPMRVIDVVEKFGEEAEQFIKKVEDRLAQEGNSKVKVEDEELTDIIDQQESNTIILGDDEHVEGVEFVEDVDSLDDIFPEDDSDTDVKTSVGDDLEDIVAELDKDEDDDFSLDDFGDDGLPEL